MFLSRLASLKKFGLLFFILLILAVGAMANIEHQNIWPTNPRNIIKHEITQLFAYNKFISDNSTEQLNWLRYIFRLEIDTLDIGFGYKYYFNSKFNHPDIPFSFIPYNYRSNYIGVAGILGDTEEDFEEDDYKSVRGHSIKYIGGEYLLHQNGFFHGLSGSYFYETRDDRPSDDYSIKRKSIGGNFGHYSNYAMLGIRGIYTDVSGNQKIGGMTHNVNYGKYVRLIPYIEHTPRPHILISAAFDYYWRTDIDAYKLYMIPVQLKYMAYRHWWEFVAGGAYKSDNNDQRQLQLAGLVRKYINNLSISVGIGYHRWWITDRNYKLSGVIFSVGGEYTFNQKLTIGLGGYYGPGSDNLFLPDADLTRYGFATAIRGYF